MGGTPGISQEDQSLNDAIQRSLDDFRTEEKEAFPLKETLREGNRCVLLSLFELLSTHILCKARCTSSGDTISCVRSLGGASAILCPSSSFFSWKTTTSRYPGRYTFQPSWLVKNRAYPNSPTQRHFSARRIWNLIELFTNMDLAKLSTIVDVEVLPSLEDEESRDRGRSTPW